LYAQKGNRRSPKDIAKQQTDWMVKELSLDKGQEEKVSAINLDFINSMFSAREKHMGDREAMQVEMKTFRKKKDAELKKVLSEDQFKLYKKKLAEMREQRKGNRGGGMK
jgi:hypothetical protein